MKNLLVIINTGIVYIIIFMILIVAYAVVYLNPNNNRKR